MNVYALLNLEDSKQQWNDASKEGKLKLPFAKLLNVS